MPPSDITRYNAMEFALKLNVQYTEPHDDVAGVIEDATQIEEWMRHAEDKDREG